jgi:hypothetical protein
VERAAAVEVYIVNRNTGESDSFDFIGVGGSGTSGGGGMYC